MGGWGRENRCLSREERMGRDAGGQADAVGELMDVLG